MLRRSLQTPDPDEPYLTEGHDVIDIIDIIEGFINILVTIPGLI
ncbi:hypothetical protein FOXYSP1_14285 [Fusarium oxysporum f. sp. phaseoli]